MKSTIHTYSPLALALATALAATTASSRAGDIQPAAAKIFAEQQVNIVSISVTRKRGTRDVTFEAHGLSLDGEGLFVTALSAIEPGANRVRRAGGGKGELSSISIYAPDGSELDADLLLTDPDLDLAFIRVKPGEGDDVFKGGAPVPAGGKAGLLDDVLGIQRMSASFQRAAAVAMFEIAAVVETPRLTYMLSAAVAPGTAVFNMAGELLGIGTRKGGTTVVIVPAAALLKLAADVPDKAAE